LFVGDWSVMTGSKDGGLEQRQDWRRDRQEGTHVGDRMFEWARETRCRRARARERKYVT
jgi:hypothetical protein